MKQRLTLFLVIGLVLVTTILALANRQVVEVNYLFGRFRLPLILVIFGAFLTGLGVQYLLDLSKLMGLKHQVKVLTRQQDQELMTKES